MLAYIGMAVLGASAFYLGWSLFSGELQGAVANRLQQQRKKSRNGLISLGRPLYTALIMPYSARLEVSDWRKKWRRRIISAGLEDEFDVDELIAAKIFYGFLVPAAIWLYFFATAGGISWYLVVGMGIGGYFYPSIWISSTRSARQIEIKLQLPFVIDLLTLSTEAGLDFIGALQKVVEKTRPGPFVDEIGRMIQQIQLGTTRADALRDLGWRIDLSEIASLVAVLVTADQMGSPLGDVLRVQSELIRTQRFTSAEKKGAAASQKLLFPLIFFIMPAVFIMIFGPVILGFFGAGK
jgi:tight adherence protein C